MSGLGQTQKSALATAMSAFHPIATKQRTSLKVCFVPKAEEQGAAPTQHPSPLALKAYPKDGPPCCREKWLKKRETKMRPGDVQKSGALTSETTEDFRYGNDWTARVKSHAGYGFAKNVLPLGIKSSGGFGFSRSSCGANSRTT
jgi:hypothetical protein